MDEVSCSCGGDRMIELKGADIGSVDFERLSKIADLIYFDGPLLSLFRDAEAENWLNHWCDTDDEVNRWLLFKVGDRELERFLRREVSLHDLLSQPKGGFLYALDLDRQLKQRKALIVSARQLPADYIPDANSFYEDNPIHETEGGLAQLKVAIDGEWEFYDFHYFPRLIRQAYAFLAAFLEQIPALNQLPLFPMRDGFSSVHLFREILEMMPRPASPRLEAVRYASPGAIVFRTDPTISPVLLDTIGRLRKENSSAALTYKFLHGILSDKKLLGLDATKARIDSVVSKQLAEQAVALANELGVPNPELLLKKTPNAVLASKIILAFYRLIERILGYEKDQKIFFPSLV